jgi:hypothetical protein
MTFPEAQALASKLNELVKAGLVVWVDAQGVISIDKPRVHHEIGIWRAKSHSIGVDGWSVVFDPTGTTAVLDADQPF